MADKIQLRAGNKEGMPTLADREPAYCRDEEALYIGTPTGNKKIGGNYDGFNLRLATVEGKVLQLEAKKVPAQADLPAEADLAAVIAAHNALLAALRSSGVMVT